MESTPGRRPYQLILLIEKLDVNLSTFIKALLSMHQSQSENLTQTIIELLKLVPVTIDVNNSCVILDNHPIPFERISKNIWGLIYEKYVGQVFEQEGWQVSYNGINKRVLDEGIDLIAIKQNKRAYIQCKFKQGKIGKSLIDNILFKSSKCLSRDHELYGTDMEFILVVNNFDQNFTKNSNKKFKTNFTTADKIEYQWLQYFLDHNYMQKKIKLKARAIQMK